MSRILTVLSGLETREPQFEVKAIVSPRFRAVSSVRLKKFGTNLIQHGLLKALAKTKSIKS